MRPPLIYHVTAADPIGGRDLGGGYNALMAKMKPGEWVAFQDADAHHTTKSLWIALVHKAVRQKPEAGAFIAVTNRLIRNLSGFQMTDESEIADDNQDLTAHWLLGTARAQKFDAELVDVTNPARIKPTYKFFSGVWFCVSKVVWDEIGGSPHGFKMLDWEIHKRIRAAGRRVYLLPGLYLYHRYRFPARGCR